MRLQATSLCMAALLGATSCGGEYGTSISDFDGYGQGFPSDNDWPNEGDSYDGVGTNPFVIAEHAPLSSFAADVDTASYDVFVRDLEHDKLPVADSVRLEEYVNYFRYDYPAPETNADHPFALHLDAAANPFNDTVILRAGMQAALPPPEEKRPTNLVFLVDISGSMTSSDKLPLVKQVLSQTLDLLDPTDTISIVTYAGATGVALPPTPVSNREYIHSIISSFEAGGSTAGAAGIDLAYSQAKKAFIDGGINHVLLCTDGDFNVGPSSTEELVTLIEEKRSTGITLTVLGFGVGNLNDSMMELISNKGNGIYGVISSEESAAKYVQERMLSSFNLVAKDVKLQIELNPEHVLAYRLLGYENRAIDDDEFRDDAIDAGEIGAGHQVTALYELVLVGGSVPAPAGAPAVVDGAPFAGSREIASSDLALFKVRYKHPGAGIEDAAIELATTVSPNSITDDAEEADGDLRWAAAVAAVAEAVKGSPYVSTDALPTIAAILDAESGDDDDRQHLVELFEVARPLLAE